MVDHVVIRRVHTPVVLRVRQRFQDLFVVLTVGKISGLPMIRGIECLRLVYAIGMRAIRAIRRMPLGRAFGLEKRERPERAYRVAFLIDQPTQNVQVVTALCQDHRAGLFTVAPRSAHKRMGLVVVPHVFGRVHGHNVAHLARRNDFFQLAVKRRIAKHMTHYDLSSELLRDRTDLYTAFERGRNRFFEQQIVSFFHTRYGVLGVVGVLRGDRHDVCLDPRGKKLFVIGKHGA